jgi:hypothetical protein
MPEALETIIIPGTNLKPTRIALGTWAIGGFMWGGTDEAESIRTVHRAIDQGINLIDTAGLRIRLLGGDRRQGACRNREGQGADRD